jgi:hypothetical protein
MRNWTPIKKKKKKCPALEGWYFIFTSPGLDWLLSFDSMTFKMTALKPLETRGNRSSHNTASHPRSPATPL